MNACSIERDDTLLDIVADMEGVAEAILLEAALR